jgi:hypothetical protein
MEISDIGKVQATWGWRMHTCWSWAFLRVRRVALRCDTVKQDLRAMAVVVCNPEEKIKGCTHELINFTSSPREMDLRVVRVVGG